MKIFIFFGGFYVLKISESEETFLKCHVLHVLVIVTGSRVTIFIPFRTDDTFSFYSDFESITNIYKVRREEYPMMMTPGKIDNG